MLLLTKAEYFFLDVNLFVIKKLSYYAKSKHQRKKTPVIAIIYKLAKNEHFLTEVDFFEIILF